MDDFSSLGIARVTALLREMGLESSTTNENDLKESARQNGLFLNDHTLEIDLFIVGQHSVMCDVIEALTGNGAARTRAKAWKEKPASFDSDQFIADIEAIGKGRYAQRLATRLVDHACPKYISEGIKYVADRCK